MKLRDLRQKIKKGTHEIARELGVAESSVRNWETGRTVPKLRIDQFARLCELYECSFETLYQAFQATAKVSSELVAMIDADIKQIRKVPSPAEKFEQIDIAVGKLLEDYEQGKRFFPRVNLSRTTQLQQTNLQGIDLSFTDLSWTVLRGTNLKESNLQEARLYRAILVEANLGQADLSRATLTSANLNGANLKGAKLIGTKFKNADLRGADLSDTDFFYANLTKADLTGANLSGTKFRSSKVENALFGNNKELSIETRIQLEYQGAIFEEPLYPSNLAGIISEVKATGLELSPLLISLIVNTSDQTVQDTIAAFKEYKEKHTIHNPEGLFYRILESQKKSHE